MAEARRFPRAGVATPHYLASAAGLATLAEGGNAVDAIVAANLALGVVAPYFCGYGGDLFAVVWDGELHGYLGSGRSPAALSIDSVHADDGAMPVLGPDTVTVPGAPAGWFDLLERWGTRSFGTLAAHALQYARDGFEVGPWSGNYFRACRALYPDAPEWIAAYGDVDTGARLRQPGLARTIESLAADGADAYYRGPIAEAISTSVQRAGGVLAPDDLARHEGRFAAPLRATYRDVEVAELPPPTQGVAPLEALRILDGLDLPDDGPERHHLLIEALKLALADRDDHVSDPDAMRRSVEALLADAHVAEQRARIDPDRAAPVAKSAAAKGGTAYLCAADGDGLLVSLIQSNFLAFGSGVHVPEWGINLNNRGSSFTLDPSDVNALAPSKLPMHTLIPALALRDGTPWLVFGSEGADAQGQVHVQVLVRMLHDGLDAQQALDAPRFRIDWGSEFVRVEEDAGAAVIDGLRARGHSVRTVGAHQSGMGLPHAIAVTANGYEVATDPRVEGAALGL
ncbi:MAG TPA: gamma-glutamyltransferase family protein [Acidimicrobiia bacterium]|nr:gamma-glutamyltransferase family protein [Acidimicrobiia bacterium]